MCACMFGAKNLLVKWSEDEIMQKWKFKLWTSSCKTDQNSSKDAILESSLNRSGTIFELSPFRTCERLQNWHWQSIRGEQSTETPISRRSDSGMHRQKKLTLYYPLTSSINVTKRAEIPPWKARVHVIESSLWRKSKVKQWHRSAPCWDVNKSWKIFQEKVSVWCENVCF